MCAHKCSHFFQSCGPNKTAKATNPIRNLLCIKGFACTLFFCILITRVLAGNFLISKKLIYTCCLDIISWGMKEEKGKNWIDNRLKPYARIKEILIFLFFWRKSLVFNSFSITNTLWNAFWSFYVEARFKMYSGKVKKLTFAKKTRN